MVVSLLSEALLSMPLLIITLLAKRGRLTRVFYSFTGAPYFSSMASAKLGVQFKAQVISSDLLLLTDMPFDRMRHGMTHPHLPVDSLQGSVIV